MRVAGLAPVENIPRLENIDVTSLVNGHMAYRAAMPRLLREVGWEVESDEFTEIEDPDPENHEERQRELIREIDEARRDAESKPAKRRFGFFKRGKLAEKKGWETYDDSMRENGHPTSTADDGTGDVLFDIEAIKAELASEQIEVKQLESTLPPMKVSLDSAPVSSGTVQNNPRANLRETKSYDPSLSYRPKASHQDSQASLPSAPATNVFNDGYNEYDDYNGTEGGFHSSANVKMSFDHPHLSPKMSIEQSRRSPSPVKSARSSMCSPSLASLPQDLPKSPSPQRSEFRSSLSMPMESSALHVEHNAWLDEDDEEFGKEKNVQMTFG